MMVAIKSIIAFSESLGVDSVLAFSRRNLADSIAFRFGTTADGVTNYAERLMK